MNTCLHVPALNTESDLPNSPEGLVFCKACGTDELMTDEEAFDQLAEELKGWRPTWGAFEYDTIVLDQSWTTPPSRRQFDAFVDMLGKERCKHCGRIYVAMAAPVGQGSVCENCGTDS